MNELKLNNLTEEYEGKCVIIPCADLPKYEYDPFDEIRDGIIEACWEKRIICDWNFKEDAFEEYDYLEDEDIKNEFWEDIVCRCLRSGFLIIYTCPVPTDVKKVNDKVSSYTTNGFGYTQTRYIHLEDISKLTTILHNIDKEMIEEAWKEQEEKK